MTENPQRMNFFKVSLQHCSRSSPWTLSGLGLITEKPQKKDKNKVLQHFVDVLLSVLINLLMIQSLTFALPASLTLEICIQIMFSMIHQFPDTQIDQMKSKLLFNIIFPIFKNQLYSFGTKNCQKKLVVSSILH